MPRGVDIVNLSAKNLNFGHPLDVCMLCISVTGRVLEIYKAGSSLVYQPQLFPLPTKYDEVSVLQL